MEERGKHRRQQRDRHEPPKRERERWEQEHHDSDRRDMKNQDLDLELDKSSDIKAFGLLFPPDQSPLPQSTNTVNSQRASAVFVEQENSSFGGKADEAYQVVSDERNPLRRTGNLVQDSRARFPGQDPHQAIEKGDAEVNTREGKAQRDEFLKARKRDEMTYQFRDVEISPFSVIT